MQRVDVTIVGGGPVGLFAAFYAGLRGMSCRIIDSLPELGGQLNALYPEKFIFDMPGFPKVLARDLASALIDQGTQFGPEVVLGETAETLVHDDPGYTIATDKGNALPTKTIIIAAGVGAFSPTKLGVDREDELHEKGIWYGVRQKSQFLGKRILIVGGGDSAFDWAMNLHDVAATIELVHRRDQFKAHEDSIRKVQGLNIPIRTWSVVRELHGVENLEAVTLEQTQTKQLERVEVDAVIVNIGFKSTLGPLKDWGLNIVKNQIVTDDQYETGLPGIYAVGDVCEYGGKLKLIATGVGEAASAVCLAKTFVDPSAKLFPGHSSDRDL